MSAAGPRADDALMTSRILGSAAFCAFVGFWLSRALFKWILGFEGTLLLGLVIGAAALGAAIGVAAALGER